MKVKRIPTIRSRLIMLVMACVIPVSLLVATVIVLNYNEERAQLGKGAIDTARAMMSAVDRDLAGVQAGMLALATSPYLQTGNLAAFYEEAKDVLTTQSANNIVLIDPTYQQLLNTLRPFGSPLPVNNNTAIQEVFKTGRSITTDVYFGVVAKKALVAVGVPVYRDGVVIYVLTAGVLPERLAGLLAQQRLSSDWIAAIHDSSGAFVARTHQMERYLGTMGSPALLARIAEVHEDSIENTTVDDVHVLSAFSKSNVSNWTVTIGIPMSVLTNELMTTLSWYVFGTSILLLSSLAVAWAIGSNIAGSLHKLVEPALALGLGQAVTVPVLRLKEADEVGQALTRASAMLRAAQHKSNHDPLTGLANRALFDEILSHQFAIAKRNKTTLAIVIIDLDGFKLVNDANGHAVGDQMLCIVATRTRNAIRGSDLAARLGGDEFALILANTGMAAAKTVAAKLIKSLSGPYPIGELTLEISASMGIAVYPESGTTIAALSKHADAAMYKAKAAGKRRYAA